MRRNWLFITLALGACLFMGMGPALAQDAVDTEEFGVFSDVVVSPGGIGDLGLGALYDVRPLDTRTPAWQNYIVVENTTGNWVAFHLRFRGWRKSIEVYDHIILLSPYDVFWVILQRATSGGTTSSAMPYQTGDVLISSADTETLLNSGLIYPDDLVDGQGYWLEQFQYFLLTDCGFGDPDLDRAALQEETQAGHFEIIGLWQLEVPSKYCSDGLCEDTHDLKNVVRDLWQDSSDTINVYDVMEALFYERGAQGEYRKPGWACDLVRISGEGTPEQDDDNETGLDGKPRWGLDCGNVLTGTMEMYDTGNGQYGLENLTFLQNFRTDAYGRIRHRDGYWGGAIVYPVTVMEWNVNYYPYDGYLHPAFYVNENWATTIGAGLRDGDDGNWWDNAPVPDFNAVWSLDDLEWALGKYEIWYQWFDLTTYDGADVTTSVNLTYPTKHYHYFWRDWPYYNGQSNIYLDGCYHPSQLPKFNPAWWGAYYVKCSGVTPVGIPFAPANIFSSSQAYVTAVNTYRGIDAEPAIDTTGTFNPCVDGAHGSIKTWFQAIYKNGPIYTEATMWDMDEHREGSTPGTPPPGSPWKPTFKNPKSIPHEVNIIIVGGGQRTGIEEATGILDEAPIDWGYTSGHFRIPAQLLDNGTRVIDLSMSAGLPICTAVTDTLACDNEVAYGGGYIFGDLWYYYNYAMPPIGWVWFTHAYAEGVDGITRSALSDWHYKSGLSYSAGRAIAP